MRNPVPITGLFLLILAQCRPPAPAESPAGYADVSRVETGKPVAVMMTAYRTTLLADGKDQTLLRLAVTDSAGREIVSAENAIRIYTEGDADVLPTAAGESLTPGTDTSGMPYLECGLQEGLCLLTLRSGSIPGIVKVEARSEGLWPGSHEIHTIPADFVQMMPEPEQLTPPSRNMDRMIGADISFLPQMEERGRKFFENGAEKDAVELLREHGFNYIRLRIFVNPEHEKGYSPEKGFCGLSHTLQMARRIQDAGMKLLLNFHYSDYWADPQQQNKPAAWADLEFEVLKDTLRSYTTRVLRALAGQGTPASMVQVGNEINHGLLWPDGHIGNPDRLAELLKAGVAGVRDADPDIPVMMHLALGGQNEEAVFWFNNMIARGVEFDIMGISYYPRWHGTLDDLYYNLNDLVARYKRPVNVVEYGLFAREVHEIVFTLPDSLGEGACIWEPLGWRGDLFNREGEVQNGILLYDELNRTYLGPGE